MEVACSVEGTDYLAHAATMLRSLLVANPAAGVRIHLMHGGDLPRRRLAKLETMVRDAGGAIGFHVVPSAWTQGLQVKGFTRRATWYRLFLPDVLPGCERVLFLDADLLVVDDLGPLWETALDDHYVAAVTNVFQADHAHWPGRVGIADPHDYFNAGVLLLDLAAMRADGCAERMLAVGRERRDELNLRDQDTLNLVLGTRRLRLHPRWNCMNIFAGGRAEAVFGEEQVREALASPAIRHYEGPGLNKPWHRDADPASRRAYAAHRAHTPWPRFRA